VRRHPVRSCSEKIDEREHNMTPRMNRWARRLAVVAISVAVSVLTFWTFIRIDPPPWKESEYFAIAFWSLPLGFLVLLVAKLPRRWVARSHIIVRLFVSVVLAAVCAVVWTWLAVALTGGYALAFDANPLLCWAAGSLAGMLAAIYWPITEKRTPA
jgi:hypothetical protein